MKTFIQNRKGQKISVLVDEVAKAKGLVFIMHGLGGFKEQPAMNMFAETWNEQGYTAVRFDTTNTFGESDGNYEDATFTNYFEDLVDVITWTKTQTWYKEPFALVGHSLGGMCVALYAEKYPATVMALAPISTVVSGKLSVESKGPEEIEQWKQTGWREEPSKTLPGVMKRLKWSHMEDRLQFDLLPEAGKLIMPKLILVGEYDTSCPPKHQQILFDAFPEPKEMHIIPGVEHSFRLPEHLEKIKSLMSAWINTL